MSIGGRLSLSSVLRAKHGMGYLAIIAVQFGIQPILAKQFISPAVTTSSVVFMGEFVKIVACLFIMHSDETASRCFGSWKLHECLVAAGIPSVTYLLQNYCVQTAYQRLDAVVFNVLNQSKVLFTALFCFFLNGKPQSMFQCIALLMVTFGGIMVSLPQQDAGSSKERSEAQDGFGFGVTCVVVAAALSGLGSGITEWALQTKKRNNYLLSLELASMGCLIIILSILLGLAPDSTRIRQEGPFVGWSFVTLIPVLTQSMSGIVVGIITQLTGGVSKVMATICGLILTCMLQQLLFGQPLSPIVLAAVPLVAGGIYMHASYPPAQRSITKVANANQ